MEKWEILLVIYKLIYIAFYKYFKAWMYKVVVDDYLQNLYIYYIYIMYENMKNVVCRIRKFMK